MSNIYHFSTTTQIQDYLKSHLQFEQTFFTETTQDFASKNTLDTVESQTVDIITVFVSDIVSPEVLDLFPNLKLIVTRSTGFDHIDLAEATSRGITVCNVPAYGTNTVAEHAFALLLTLSKRLYDLHSRTKQNNFEYLDLQGIDLQGKTISVLGAGKIGKNLIQIAKGFQMKVLVYDIFQNEALAESLGFSYVSLEQALAEADILSLHLPLTPETKDILSLSHLERVKPGCIFLNVSRGDLITNQDLLTALEKGYFSAAGLDTLQDEKSMFAGKISETQQKLLSHERVIFTPHSAYYTKEALERILETSCLDIQSYQNGEIINQVIVN